MKPQQSTHRQPPLQTYICPMHPEVMQDGPGACPKCGMALEPMMPTTPAVEYTCLMHPEIVRYEPGVCPKCGMALEPRTQALRNRKIWNCVADATVRTIRLT